MVEASPDRSRARRPHIRMTLLMPLTYVRRRFCPWGFASDRRPSEVAVDHHGFGHTASGCDVARILDAASAGRAKISAPNRRPASRAYGSISGLFGLKRRPRAAHLDHARYPYSWQDRRRRRATLRVCSGSDASRFAMHVVEQTHRRVASCAKTAVGALTVQVAPSARSAGQTPAAFDRKSLKSARPWIGSHQGDYSIVQHLVRRFPLERGERRGDVCRAAPSCIQRSWPRRYASR